MPPIPTDTASLLANIQRRLSDLRDFQLPRLRDCRGPVDIHRELAEEFRSDLDHVVRSIAICKELAESERSSVRDTTISKCEQLEHDSQSLRVKYREALLHSKRAISATSKRRHELLTPLASGESGSGSNAGTTTDKLKAKPSVGLKDEDALQTKTNEVTDALRRTTQIMQQELERSVLSVQMLEESTRTLRTTTSLYDTYSSLLTTSTKLVKAIEKADWYDRLIIGLAFLFFLLCMGWIIKRRVLDKVVGGVGWWVWGSARLLGMGLGLGRSSSREVAMTALVDAGGNSGFGSQGKVLEGVKVGESKLVRSGGGEQAGIAAKRLKQGHGEQKSILDTIIPDERLEDSTVLLDSKQIPDDLDLSRPILAIENEPLRSKDEL